MNFDRTGFFSQFAPAEADWGIEETAPRKRYDSVSNSDYSQPPRIRDGHVRPPALYSRSGSFGVGSETYASGSGHFEDVGKFRNEHPEFERQIVPTTGNFRKFIAKYLCLHSSRASVEKFKYNLVLSNLLDESLVLSKNEQALQNLLQARQAEDHYLPIFLRKKLDNDGIQLKIVNKTYLLLLPAALENPVLLLNTIGLIIFLMKQRQNRQSRFRKESQIKLFKILLISATRILKSKRAHAIVESSRSLRSLDDFMISNCNINKVLIAHMITLKEFDMFTFLNKSSAATSPNTYSKTLKKHLDTLLTCLLLNIRHSIRELLPFSNGDLLEKYCSINNVQVSTLYDTPEHEELTLETLTAKLTLFNNHRRFLVCQLLTIHDSHVHNFFVLTLCDHFNIDLDTPRFYSSSYKAAKLNATFHSHTATLDQISTLNGKFKILYNSSRSADYASDDILSGQKFSSESHADVFAADSELDLNNLIDKMSGIVASLKYFKKYSQSIANLDNAEEHDERLSIFGSFQSELHSCLDLFGTCMSEYRADFSAKFRPVSSTSSSSQRNSQNSENPFNLKSFRTSAKAKKKYQTSDSQASEKDAKSDKRSKRMSTGLQLGLLTVLEDPRSAINDQRSAPLPTSANSNHGSYNQAALEALTKKMSLGNANRFSMASVNSNVSGFSDLIASTQITTDEDDGGSPKTKYLPEGGAQGMSKTELARKLEESFTRIYNLESENYELRSKTPTSEATEEHTTRDESEPLFSVAKDSNFLRNLEETLSTKHAVAEPT